MPKDHVPVWPCFVYRDAEAAVAWLQEAFGFEPAVVVPGDAARPVAHAELRTPWGGGIMFGSAGSEVDGVGTGRTYVVVDDPDALHARAVAAGAEIVRPLEDTDFGSRTFTARDPEGNEWSFGTYAGE
jgi:uncharacterized glyoxalase superfamily protein PhnB